MKLQVKYTQGDKVWISKPFDVEDGKWLNFYTYISMKRNTLYRLVEVDNKVRIRIPLKNMYDGTVTGEDASINVYVVD